jgi:chemotaxis protein histidine kinase CheA/ActR/RegA family two-component response regulator
MDRLADRSARLRVLSVAGSGAVERLFRLAGLAETGVNERAPRQILATLATSLRQLGIEVEAGQRRLQRLSEGLLETFLQQQVRPLQPVLYHLADHAGELAESLGKDVGVTVAGGETVLDRRIISALQESLLHVVRNAVDHGIEPPNDRREAGKPAAGQIVIEAKSELDRVRLTMRDDGRGIDPKEVVDAARSRGQLSDDEPTASTAEDILRLLCRPGVSTRREASEISGRGIGLDAVAATVQSVGGDLWLESTPGRGTTVTLELPVTRRGERVLVLGVGQLRVALPAAPVKSYRRLDLTRGPDGSVELPRDDDGRPMDLRFLADLVNRPRGGPGTVVIGSTAGAPLAVVADSVLGEEEVFVRPLPPEIGAPPVYDGVALTGSGRPVAVLSWQQMAHRPEHWTDRAVEDLTVATIRVLLVDDSRVTREMIRRLLEDAGFSVVAVGSAEEAIHELERGELDCLITDIEMPEIDGLELTRRLRDHERFQDLPIIVVSTRDRPTDHRAGLDAGADAYLSKQGLEAAELVALVRRAGGGGA